MRRIAGIVSFVIAVVAGPSLFAQATRTWISGVGDDVNPCSRTAPCKTFAGAMGKTAAGGEISVLDPGGYGAVTITKSITLSGTGTLASILFSQTNGITINGAGIVVNIVDLSLNGGTPTAPGINGIRIIAAAHVSVTNCDIFNYSANGILDERTVAGVLTVKNTRIHNSIPFGASLLRTGITIGGASNAANKFVCDGCLIFGNEGNNSVGIFTTAGASGTIIRSELHSNVRGVYTVTGNVTVSDTAIYSNSYGVRAGGGGTVRLFNSSVTSNTIDGLEFTGGGTIVSFGNNAIHGNVGNNGAGLTTVALQ